MTATSHQDERITKKNSTSVHPNYLNKFDKMYTQVLARRPILVAAKKWGQDYKENLYVLYAICI